LLLNRVTLRPVGAGDEPFLYEVFASTRAEEIALTGWPAAQQETYLRRQFNAQQEHYLSEFPQGEHSIILIDDRPIGRLFISRTFEAIDLVDISLLPRPRAAGIGTRLIESLLDEGNQAGKPVRLYVFRFDGASRLCERLGFRRLGESPPRLQVEAALSG
jgi:GNAT superfamily N-acetyltransferase